MSYMSVHQFRQSLPNRSPSQRPRSLSLSEYQPLNFDREALQAQYQQSLNQYTSSHPSTSHPSLSSFEGPGSLDSNTSTSTLSQFIKPGDNPHKRAASDDLTHTQNPQPQPPPINDNFAGVGAGHSLTPPASPLHRSAQAVHRASLLSPIQGTPPPPPPRPNTDALPETTFYPNYEQEQRSRENLGLDVDYFGTSAIAEGSSRAPRALPQVPMDVSAPEPPAWEPDYKPQIPTQFTQSSIENAYAQLSAPPPNLPPRRTQPIRQASVYARSQSADRAKGKGRLTKPPLPGRISTNNHHTTSSMSIPRAGTGRSGVDAEGDVMMNGGAGLRTPRGESPASPITPRSPVTPVIGPSSLPRGLSSPTITKDGRFPPPPPLPAGAPDYPPDPPFDLPKPPKPVRQAEHTIELRATSKTPIWSTHYIDPTLRDTLVTIPHQVTNITNMALTGLSSGPKTRFNTTTGAPIDGMAKLAKSWFVKPDAIFESESGAIDLSLGVIDSGGEKWGIDKGRKRARVEIRSKSGGIKLDLIEVDEARQIDLKIETKTGDILVLLPENFEGPIHITSPTGEPKFLNILQPQLQPLVHPYESFYTTYLTPLKPDRLQDTSRVREINAASKIDKYIPKALRGQNDYIDQFVGGYAAHTRGDQCKISVSSSKGRIVLGYRGTRDEEEAKGLGLKVGVEQQRGQQKKKKWWK